MYTYSKPVQALSSIRSASFVELVCDYERALLGSGYNPHVVRFHLHAVTHFGVWLELKGAGLGAIRGIKLHANTARGVFRRLIYRLGIARPEDKLRPRLHDLRFYFANQSLTHSPCDHDGIGRHMVALTTYLGHSDVRNGYWYLEATPALFAKIAAQCEDFAIGGNL